MCIIKGQMCGNGYVGRQMNENNATATNIISKIDLSRDAITVSCFTERLLFFSRDAK